MSFNVAFENNDSFMFTLLCRRLHGKFLQRQTRKMRRRGTMILLNHIPRKKMMVNRYLSTNYYANGI